MYSPTLAKTGFVLAGNVCSIIDFALACYLAYQGAWLGAAIGIAGALGIAISANTWL